MSRKKGRKAALSTLERVRMCRKRKKLLNIQNQEINHHFLQQSGNNVLSALPNKINNDDNHMKYELRDWANTHHVSKRAINGLLSILNSSGMNEHIPKNYRTLQKTPVNILITPVAGGNLWYNGLGNCLRKIFETLSRDLVISLKFNIDGLPLFNSSKTCFWPILASISGECERFQNWNSRNAMHYFK